MVLIILIFSILIPWMEAPGGLQSVGLRRVRQDWKTSLSLFTFMHWRRKWQPTPVFLPGESQDRGGWSAAFYGVTQSRTRLKWLSRRPLSRWCHSTISSSVIPSPLFFNLSQLQGLFQWVSSSHQVAKYWSFTFNISPSSEHPRLISFRKDWMDLLAVQETLQESSPTQQFKTINSLALSFLYSLTHIHTWLLEKP